MTQAEFEHIARELVKPCLSGIGLRLSESTRNGRWYCDEYKQPGDRGWSVAVFYELGDWYPDVRAEHRDGRVLTADQFGEHLASAYRRPWPETEVVSADGRTLIQHFRRLYCVLAAEVQGLADE